MIDYLDYIQYAEIDLEKTRKFFNDEEYNSAAFYMQQALEKYVKAFFLKFNLIDDPQKLGHLQYHEIFNKLKNMFEKEKNSAIEIVDINMLNSLVKHYNTLYKLTHKIKNSPEYKILLWKTSLQLELSKHEKNLLFGFTSEINKTANGYMISLTDFCTSGSFNSNLSNLPVELQNIISQTVSQFLEAKENNDFPRFTEIRNQMMDLIKPFTFGSGKKSLSKSNSEFIFKMNLIETSLEWYDTVLLSYPHQELSRYPLSIEDSDISELYKVHSDKLLNLIELVESTCKMIRIEISRNSPI